MEELLPKSEEESYSQVLKDSFRETLIKSAGIVVANPFRVVAIRQIAAIAGDTHVKGLMVCICFWNYIPIFGILFQFLIIVRF